MKKVIALIDYKGETLSNTDDFVARSLYRTKTEVKEANLAGMMIAAASIIKDIAQKTNSSENSEENQTK